MVEKNQQARVTAGQSFDQSRADATSRSCNQDGFTGVRCAVQRCVHVRVQLRTGFAGAYTSALKRQSSMVLVRDRQEDAIIHGNRTGEERGGVSTRDSHVPGMAG